MSGGRGARTVEERAAAVAAAVDFETAGRTAVGVDTHRTRDGDGVYNVCATVQRAVRSDVVEAAAPMLVRVRNCDAN